MRWFSLSSFFTCTCSCTKLLSLQCRRRRRDSITVSLVDMKISASQKQLEPGVAKRNPAGPRRIVNETT